MTTTPRRRFLAQAAGSLLGVAAMPGLVRAASAAAPARRVIYLYLGGGLSHLDSFDPKPGATTQGPVEAIDTNVPGIQLTEHFPHLARLADRVAFVRSMQTTQGAHAQGRYVMHTSYTMRGTIRHPSLGAWAHRSLGALHPDLPAHVAIGGGIYDASQGWFDTAYQPLPLGDPEKGLPEVVRPAHVSSGTFERRMARLRHMNDQFTASHDTAPVRAAGELFDQAVSLLGSRDLEAFDLSGEDESLRDAYGRGHFGQGCLLARRLIERGTRFVEVVDGGWDMHNEIFDVMAEKGPSLDRTLATLLMDVESRGLLDDTLIVVATEFGRKPDLDEARGGRGHHPQAFTCLLAGAGIRGGQAYGATDAEGREVVANAVRVPDFNATIATALGLSTDEVLMSPSGRPFRVADRGTPVTGLLA